MDLCDQMCDKQVRILKKHILITYSPFIKQFVKLSIKLVKPYVDNKFPKSKLIWKLHFIIIHKPK